MVTRKQTQDGTHVRVMAWIPRELHERIVALILLSGKPMTYYVTRGLRHAVSDARRYWPAEYLTPTLADREALAQVRSRYRWRYPKVSTAAPTIG